MELPLASQRHRLDSLPAPPRPAAVRWPWCRGWHCRSVAAVHVVCVCILRMCHGAGCHHDQRTCRWPLQVQLLLLEVEAGGMPPGANEADVVLGYASLGVLFSAMQTVRLGEEFVSIMCQESCQPPWACSSQAMQTVREIVEPCLVLAAFHASTHPSGLDLSLSHPPLASRFDALFFQPLTAPLTLSPARSAVCVVCFV